MLSFIIFTILLNYPERIVVRYGEFWPQLYYRQDIACDMHCAYARERFTVYTYAVLSLCMVGPHWRETRFSLSRVMLNNMIISAAIIYVLFVVKPFSVTNNSVGSRTAAAGYVGAAIVDHVARSGSSRIDAVICNWKGLKTDSVGKRFVDAMFL